MEALRFPWDDEQRREVAPSKFRPRKSGALSRSPGRTRSQAGKPIDRRDDERGGPPRRTGGHASRPNPRDGTAGRVVRGPQRERHEPDYVLLAVAVALSALGILMVYSSTGFEAADEGGNVFGAVTTQLGWGMLGGLVLLALMRIDYRYWRSFSILGIVVALVLLVLVIGPRIPPLLEPVAVRGSYRWLQIGGLPTFQPTEVAKLALVVFAAHWLTARGKQVGSFRHGLLPFSLLVGLIAILVVLEPDLGTSGVLVLTAFSMFFVAGGSLWQILLLAPVGLAAVGGAVMMKPYMLERIHIFFEPFSDITDTTHQTAYGLFSLSSGGITGKGLGVSQQPDGLRVPAAENDFIFAVVGQELGLIGGLLVIGLFLLLAWRGMRIAMHAPDTFGGLLALGITAWLTFQAFINIGVVVLLIPMTGMPLPFLSDGGTSLVVALAAVGILLSISRETTSSSQTSSPSQSSNSNQSTTRGASAH